MLPLFYLILVTSLLSNCVSTKKDECERFCPEDLKESFFEHLFNEELQLVESTVQEILNGIQKMKDSVPNFEANLRSLGKSSVDYIDDPLETVQQEIDVSKRSHIRGWNMISDTLQDVLDPSRSPQAPKTLTNLRETIDALQQNYKTNEEHMIESIEEALKESADLLKPIVLLMEMLIKSGGENNPTLEKLSGNKINNFLGRTIWRLTKIKQGETKTEEVKIFDHLQKLSKIMGTLFVIETKQSWDIQYYFWVSVNKLLMISDKPDLMKSEDLAVNILSKLMDLENTAQDYLTKVVAAKKNDPAL